VQHSEFNHAPQQVTHFFQIWIEPNVHGIEPSYEQVTVPTALKRGQLARIAGPEQAAVRIHADASLYAGLFDGQEAAQLTLAAGRRGYVHLVRGSLRVNGESLQAGDALLLADESRIQLDEGQDAEVLVFDLAQ
jgi:redox-sensitive bicupin YhaK (pirin superfamily)